MIETVRNSERGLTLIELLIGLFLTGIVVAAGLHFYAAQSNVAHNQYGISDMQQNLRAALGEILQELRNAGANLPAGMPALAMADSNPDTLIIRYAPMNSSLVIGAATEADGSSPLKFDTTQSLSAFTPGRQAYVWYSDRGRGEWVTITGVATSTGTGWNEVYHHGQTLLFDPRPGHSLVALHEVQYYVDASDSAHPVLMRATDGLAGRAFAENISDAQFRCVLSTLDTVSTLNADDTVHMVQVMLAAHTPYQDQRAIDAGLVGRRDRTLAASVVLRNNQL